MRYLESDVMRCNPLYSAVPPMKHLESDVMRCNPLYSAVPPMKHLESDVMLYNYISTTLHHFLSISLEEQWSITNHILHFTLVSVVTGGLVE